MTEQVQNKRTKKVKSATEAGMFVAGTSLNIFGSLPLEIHFLYYLGSLPFVIAFLYFWFDMSQSAYADDRLIGWSLVLILLFVWMKCWQTVYVNKLNHWIYGIPMPAYTLRGIIRLIIFTAIVQPSGFILVPVSMILGFPYMTAGFFYQDILLSEHLYTEGFLRCCVGSYRCAKQGYSQSMVLMWLFSPWQMGAAVFLICVIVFINRYFGLALVTAGNSTLLIASISLQIALITALLSPVACMLAIGIAGAAFLVPWMLEHLFGIETSLSHGYRSMLSSTSFFAVVYFLVFLVLDPLMKISMVIRRFQYNSRGNGEDILLALKNIIRGTRDAAGVLIFLSALSGAVLLPSALHGEIESDVVDAMPESVELRPVGERGQLDTALDATLRQSRYTWRMQRQLKKKKADDSVSKWYSSLDSFMKKIAAMLQKAQEDFADWLKKVLGKESGSDKNKRSWLLNIGWAEAIFYLLFSAVMIFTLIRLLKWRRARQKLIAATRKDLSGITVDLHDHSVSPDDLPPDEWLDLADSLIAQGNYRAAVRALFLGVLAKLGETGFVTLRAYKSNYDYRRELAIRARDRMEIGASFGWLCQLMECTWYGFVPVTEQMCDDFQLKSAALRRNCSADSAEEEQL